MSKYWVEAYLVEDYLSENVLSEICEKNLNFKRKLIRRHKYYAVTKIRKTLKSIFREQK